MKKTIAIILVFLNIVLRLFVTKSAASIGVYTTPGLITYAIAFSLSMPLILVAIGSLFKRNRTKGRLLTLLIVGSILILILNVLKLPSAIG